VKSEDREVSIEIEIIKEENRSKAGVRNVK
jgi:hypothetical protein